MFYCKQTPDYLPSPEAVMVTGITPQQCNAEGVPEPEFAARIHAEFSQPNTCILGYNNIRYDDEMTRYTFSAISLIRMNIAGKTAIRAGIYWILFELVTPCARTELNG
ncbi:exonuclease I [Actinobacillus equuli]|nr:exonuclease I [Actinobacillus equuli]